MYTIIDKTATITNAVFSSDKTTITYTYSGGTNLFSIGNIVTISGIIASTASDSSNYNISDGVVTAITSNTFTIPSSFIPTSISSYLSGGTVTHDPLREAMDRSPTISTNAAIIGEWNLNIAQNITNVGNYKNRPTAPGNATASSTFVQESSSTSNPTWYGYTDSTTLTNGSISVSGTDIPQTFLSIKEKMKNLYSIVDTTGKFRPRSGINKLLFFSHSRSRYFPFLDSNLANRPRFYPADINDPYKYWTSYRTETSGAGTSATVTERGISKVSAGSGLGYLIDDVSPFLTYTGQMPANRIVVKMQTGVGNIDMSSQFGFSDPFYGYSNQNTPVNWKIQYLDSTNTWQDAIAFNSSSTRRDGTNIIKTDGYVELCYGLNVTALSNTLYNAFYFAGTYSSFASLPTSSIIGYGYLVQDGSNNNAGTIYVWNGSGYTSTPAVYGWMLHEEAINRNTPFVTQMVETSSLPFPQYKDNSGNIHYKEFQYIQGIRIIVNSMNTYDSTFDLIEMSARLAINLSDKTESLTLKKSASDLGQSGLPVGQLLVSTGSITLFDYDKAFSDNNTSSLISQFSLNSRYKPIRKMRLKPPKKSKSSSSYIQIKIYDIVENINNLDYYVPIKTMYVDGFPEIGAPNREVVINLRDLYFYFESTIAPQLFISDTTVSFAIAMLMDSIGFSNYSIKMLSGENDPVIPFFFVKPDTTIAQVLNDIATSFQMAMFFDEYNNLVIMSKNYLMPGYTDRPTNLTIYGSGDSFQNGVLENQTSNVSLTSIVDIKTEQDRVFNDGQINYTSRYIQKSTQTIAEQSLQNSDVVWKYKPVLLWEIASPDNARPANEQVSAQKGYPLSAIPLNTDLSADLPVVYSGNATITAATSLNQIVTYSATNSFSVGQTVYISNLSNSAFNVSGATIISATSSSFQIYANIANATISSQSGNAFVNGISNNIIDLGEAVQYLGRYNGYFYANGEVIKFDAVEYSVSGLAYPVWITSVLDYQNYFSKLTFGGKIYPTGRVKIYAEPYYKTMYDVDGVTPLYDSNGMVITQMIPGAVAKHGRMQFGTGIRNNDGTMSPVSHSAGLNSYWSNDTNTYGLLMDSSILLGSNFSGTISYNSAAGVSTSFANFAKTTQRTGIIKNILSATYNKEKISNVVNPGTTQSSALIMSGKKVPSSITNNPIDFVSYVYKPLVNTKHTHFGTRMRIVGEISNQNNQDSLTQNPVGSNPFYKTVGGSSGGIAISVNPSTNFGYYFEIAALTEGSVGHYQNSSSPINNIFFYKIGKDSSKTASDKAIPKVLWSGLGQIIVDNGQFTGQSRQTNDQYTTVYDLAVEYEIINDTNKSKTNKIIFYLYINDKLVAVVEDTSPLISNGKPFMYDSFALFTRGSSKIMFENVYALGSNLSQDSSSNISAPATTINNKSVFGADTLNTNNAFKKYAISGMVQSIYLDGLHPSDNPKYDLYFDEFGTIMREAAYINARYDKAYPALLAKLAPTFNDVKGYVVSGFTANAYNAEFLIFNATDTTLVLDDTTGNYLRILGVTFTQGSTNQLTVDDYFGKRTDLSNPQIINGGNVDSPYLENATYSDLKNSRSTYGKNAFTLEAPYIQTQDSANDLMGWITSKLMQSRYAVGLNIFSHPTIQLGDIVEIRYDDSLGNPEIAIDGTRFVVYSIQYDRDESGPNTLLYLSEIA